MIGITIYFIIAIVYYILTEHAIKNHPEILAGKAENFTATIQIILIVMSIIWPITIVIGIINRKDSED